MTEEFDSILSKYQYIPALKRIETDPTLPCHGLHFPILKYRIPEWNKVKADVNRYIPDTKDLYMEGLESYTDYDEQLSTPYYFDNVVKVLQPVLDDFQKFLPIPIEIAHMCCQVNRKEMYREPFRQSHFSSNGFSGIFYAEYNRSVHGTTTFILPTPDYIFGGIKEYEPSIQEGDVIFFPSSVWHYQKPNRTLDYFGLKQVFFDLHGKMQCSKLLNGREYIDHQTHDRANLLKNIIYENMC